jgi:putative two-component system response regulator
VAVARNGCEALELIRTGRYQLLVSDWEMPEMTGIELCRNIRQRYAASYVYIILLTAHRKTENVLEGLRAGADDFVTKPFHPQELCLRVRTGERILGVETRELTIFSLAKLAESRDNETGAHLERIREYCQVIANHLAEQGKFAAEVDGSFIHLIYLTSPLHDIGKVGIPDHVLLKPGPLTPEEFEIMKQHTIIGSETLDAAARAHPEAKFLHLARDIARSHHEKYDGSGYPDGLSGDCIPLCGRIVALADVYDALTTKRVYKPAFSHVLAREIILEDSGKHFDPDVVLAFVENEDRFLAIHDQFAAADEEALVARRHFALTPA